MITAEGYSKNKNIVPEGIVVTFSKSMIDEQGGLICFIRNFEETMKDEKSYWMHKLKNNPVHDILYVYVIVHGKLYCRCFFGGWQIFDTIGYTANNEEKVITWPGIILSGPFLKCPFKRRLKGFRGFRYCTKLF